MSDGARPCACTARRWTLDSAIRVHPQIDGCLRIEGESPLFPRRLKSLVIKVRSLTAYWPHFRQILMNSGAEPHLEWRWFTDSDLVEAGRHKSFRRAGDDDDDEVVAKAGESIWDDVVPPRHVVFAPLGGTPGKRDVVHEALVARLGKGKPSWLLLVEETGWAPSRAVKETTREWEVVVLP